MRTVIDEIHLTDDEHELADFYDSCNWPLIESESLKLRELRDKILSVMNIEKSSEFPNLAFLTYLGPAATHLEDYWSDLPATPLKNPEDSAQKQGDICSAIVDEYGTIEVFIHDRVMRGLLTFAWEVFNQGDTEMVVAEWDGFSAEVCSHISKALNLAPGNKDLLLSIYDALMNMHTDTPLENDAFSVHKYDRNLLLQSKSSYFERK